MEETNIYDNQESINVATDSFGDSSQMVANSQTFDEPISLTVTRLERRISELEAIVNNLK